MKQATEIKIKNVKTLNEFLNVLNSEFKTVECKPSHFIKVTLIYTLISKLNGQSIVIPANVKAEATQAPNISEFINVIKLNFNCEQKFTNTNNLISDTNKLLILTGLKEKDENEAPAKPAPAKKIVKPETPLKKKPL